MSKGPSQVGTKTTTSIDPLRQEQARYLGGGWQSALNLLEQVPQQPYGGPRVTEWGQPEKTLGYENLYNTGVNASGIANAGLNPYYAATSGQYGGQYSPAYGGMQNIAAGTGAGQQGAMSAADLMGQYGQMGAGWGQNYGGLAGQTGQTAGQTGQQYGNMLQQTAAQIPGMVQPYQSQLGFNAATAVGGNPAQNLLRQQASGAYLNSNPYLDSMYGSAADAVTRQYQTATAPRTESSYEQAGRYGSPSLGNAVSQNQQNLGKTLGNMAADIYGTNYGRERTLQNQATETLGSQYLSGLGQSTQAANAAGNLGLGAAQQQLAGYNMGGNQALQGLLQQTQGYNTAGNLGLTGYNQAANASQGAGQLDLAGTLAQQRALEGLQQGYYQGNAQSLAGSTMADQMIRNSFLGPQAQAQAGAGLAGIDQPKIDAAMSAWKEQQAAPWTNLSNYMALIGQPTGQSSINQAPIYGSPLAQGIGMLGAGANALGGKGGSGSGSGSGYYGDTGLGRGMDASGYGGDYGGGGGGGGKGGGDIFGTVAKTAMNFLPFLL